MAEATSSDARAPSSDALLLVTSTLVDTLEMKVEEVELLKLKDSLRVMPLQLKTESFKLVHFVCVC